MSNPSLARTWLRQIDLLVSQDLRPTIFVHSNCVCLHHLSPGNCRTELTCGTRITDHRRNSPLFDISLPIGHASIRIIAAFRRTTNGEYRTNLTAPKIGWKQGYFCGPDSQSDADCATILVSIAEWAPPARRPARQRYPGNGLRENTISGFIEH
jgi:hypothetical protein